MGPHTRFAGVLVAAALLAGCVGGGAGEDASDTPRGDTGAADPAIVSNRVTLAFERPGDVTAVRWENGSFGPHEHNFPVGFAVSQATRGSNPADHLHDVGGDVPAGVPATITLEVSWSPEVRGSLQLRLHRADSDEVYTWGESYDQGSGVLAVVMKRTDSGPLLAGVRYNSPDAQERLEYSLRATVHYNSTVVPGGVPVTVEAPSGSRGIHFRAVEGGGDVLVWDPRDAFVGRYTVDDVAAIDLGQDEPGGAYVFMTTAPGGVVVSLETADGPEVSPLSALGQEYVVGQERSVPPGGSIEWAFTVDRHPLTVLILLLESTALEHIDVAVEGPAGPVVAASVEGPVLLTDWWWAAGRGDESLVPGSYEVTWESGASAGVTIAEAAMYYRR